MVRPRESRAEVRQARRRFPTPRHGPRPAMAAFSASYPFVFREGGEQQVRQTALNHCQRAAPFSPQRPPLSRAAQPATLGQQHRIRFAAHC